MKTPLVLTSAVALFLLACGGSQSKQLTPLVVETTEDAGVPDTAPPSPPLFARIGGREVLVHVVDSFLANANADSELKKAFAKTTGAKAEHFKAAFVDQLCQLSGGPCNYAGKSMRDAHKGMKVTEAQWKSFMQDLDFAMQENKIADADRAELSGLLMPLKEETIEAAPLKK